MHTKGDEVRLDKWGQAKLFVPVGQQARRYPSCVQSIHGFGFTFFAYHDATATRGRSASRLGPWRFCPTRTPRSIPATRGRRGSSSPSRSPHNVRWRPQPVHRAGRPADGAELADVDVDMVVALVVNDGWSVFCIWALSHERRRSCRGSDAEGLIWCDALHGEAARLVHMDAVDDAGDGQRREILEAAEGFARPRLHDDGMVRVNGPHAAGGEGRQGVPVQKLPSAISPSIGSFARS